MGRPKKTQPITKQIQEKRNEIVLKTTDYQLVKIDEMAEKFPKYLQKRADKFAKEYMEYIEEHSQSGSFIADDDGKIPFFELTQHAFKPIIKVAGATPAYSADQMSIALDYYMDCTEKMNQYGIYIPKVEDFCRMLNISTKKFKEYKESSNDPNMREVCYLIEDYCTAITADAAMSAQIEGKYAMFHQRSSNYRRDNDPIQNNTFIQNNGVLSDSQLNDLMKRYINE